MTRLLPLLALSFLLTTKLLSQTGVTDAKAAAIPEASCASVESLASYIKDNFTTDTTRIRAIYVWITHHISYDVARLKARELDPFPKPQAIADVLATRSAVCQGYSDLFAALCKAVGIDAVVVSGYTRKGNSISPISHAWVAAQLAGDWYLFDPTWGAGYIRNDRFEMRFNERFYKVTPDVLIKDHMPFDPVYQFLSYPLSHKEFIESSPATGKTWFNYKDSLQHHLSLSAMEQRSAELRRLEAAGIQNDQLLKRQLYLKKSLQHFASRDASEEGRQLFKTASDTYKEFLVHKNKQFSTASETELRSMLDSMMQSIKAARALLTELEPKTDQQRQFKAGNLSSLDRLWAQLTREREFVDQYFATEPDKRKLMFAKKQTN